MHAVYIVFCFFILNIINYLCIPFLSFPILHFVKMHEMKNRKKLHGFLFLLDKTLLLNLFLHTNPYFWRVQSDVAFSFHFMNCIDSMNIGNIRIDSLNDRASQILEGDHTIVISYNTAKSMNKGDILFTSNVNLHSTCEKK